MFGSASNSSLRNSDASRQQLPIPMRFVWPYGGRRVFLSGSFTRWTEHIPMSPIEGCPNVFQVICSLTPGYHQYKFFVDGEWKHDEHQPFVSENYGVVNTIFIAGGPDMVPSGFSPETLGRSNMEVDYAFVQAESIPRMSEADLKVSHQRISVFLSTHTAYELLPESGKVIALDVNLPVKQAFHILYEQGIPLAPLWDFAEGLFVGVLTPLDFILILRENIINISMWAVYVRLKEGRKIHQFFKVLIMPYGHSLFPALDEDGVITAVRAELGNHGSNLTEEELETHTIAAWKEGNSHLSRQTDGHLRTNPRHLVQAGPYDSLKDVALKILQNKVAAIPIIHSSSLDGSYPQLLHLASLSGILKCICRYFRHSSGSLPVLQQPISSIPLGTWLPKIGETGGKPLAMLRPSASLGAALSLLVQAEVSSIPIVDENDSLLDIYSRSDITALAKDKAYAQIRLDELSVHQALQLGQETNPPYGLFNGQRCHMCLRSDPLHKVMERLANPGVRRLVIVEAGSKRVEGVISLTDVFRFLLGF